MSDMDEPCPPQLIRGAVEACDMAYELLKHSDDPAWFEARRKSVICALDRMAAGIRPYMDEPHRPANIDGYRYGDGKPCPAVRP